MRAGWASTEFSAEQLAALPPPIWQANELAGRRARKSIGGLARPQI